MRENRQDRGEILDRAFGAAGQIHDQRAAADAGDRTAEHGVRRHAQAGRAHRLGQPRRIALDHRTRRLRRDIARGKARAARRQHQVEPQLICRAHQPRADCRALIGDDLGDHYLGSGQPLGHGLRQRRAAQVGSLTARAAVADGEDADANCELPYRSEAEMWTVNSDTASKSRLNAKRRIAD